MTTIHSSQEQNKYFLSTKADTILRLMVDQVYSQKELAVLRELSANAYDSHVEAGMQDVPFDVTLPTHENPSLIIRDYGTGLTHTQIKDVYLGVGVSTKKDKNDQIGHMGIGAKVPFAISDSFMTISYVGGKKLTYLNTFLKDSEPSCTLLSEEETNERNGLQIIVPVPQAHLRNVNWNNIAANLFTHFTVHPNIQTDNISIYKSHVIPFTRNFIEGISAPVTKDATYTGYYKSRFSTLHIRIGQLVYPVSQMMLTPSIDISGLFLSSLVVDVPIDSVTVSASREELSYDAKTVTFLNEFLVETYNRLVDSIIFNIRKQETIYDKMILLSSTTVDYGFDIDKCIFTSSFQESIRKIYFSLSPHQKVYQFGVSTDELFKDLMPGRIFNSTWKPMLFTNIPHSTPTIIIYSDGKRCGVNKIKEYVRHHLHHTGISIILNRDKSKSVAFHKEQAIELSNRFLGKAVRLIPFSDIDKKIKTPTRVVKPKTNKAESVKISTNYKSLVEVEFDKSKHTHFIVLDQRPNTRNFSTLLSRRIQFANVAGVKVGLENLVIFKSEDEYKTKNFTLVRLADSVKEKLEHISLVDETSKNIIYRFMADSQLQKLALKHNSENFIKILNCLPELKKVFDKTTEIKSDAITMQQYNTIATTFNLPALTTNSTLPDVAFTSLLNTQLKLFSEYFPMIPYLATRYTTHNVDEKFEKVFSQYLDMCIEKIR